MRVIVDCKSDIIAWLMLDAVEELAEKIREEARSEPDCTFYLADQLDLVKDQIRKQLEKI